MTDRSTPVSRRSVLKGVAAAGVAAPVLAACGGGSGSGSGTSGGGTVTTVKAADVPVGGGVVSGQAVVVQPSAGTFKAYSAVCTHAGCLVSQVQDGEIICPCHGSTFAVATGAPDGGPAPSPLGALTATVQGDSVIVTG
ncbi:MAG TPA: Rieske (2Fe-2S) protein [Actinomycetes bacterium]